MKRYVNQFSSVFILFTISKAMREPLSYGDLFVSELEDFIPFDETMELWEVGDIDTLGEILVDGVFNYCLHVSGKYPTQSTIYYEQLWRNNIEKGLKSVGLRAH